MDIRLAALHRPWTAARQSTSVGALPCRTGATSLLMAISAGADPRTESIQLKPEELPWLFEVTDIRKIGGHHAPYAQFMWASTQVRALLKDQLAEIARAYQGVGAMHVVSHGARGSLTLGSSVSLRSFARLESTASVLGKTLKAPSASPVQARCTCLAGKRRLGERLP